jgi:hypothetical protein
MRGDIPLAAFEAILKAKAVTTHLHKPYSRAKPDKRSRDPYAVNSVIPIERVRKA